MLGKAKCYHHGGRSLVGAASPTFRHGRWSKGLPKRIIERYDVAAGDQELLELREDIALTDAQITDRIGLVDSGESGAAWRALRKANRRVARARTRGDVDAMATALDEVTALIEAGTADRAAWADVNELLEQRRRFVDTEVKRLHALYQYVTTEEVMALVGALVELVRTHVEDVGIRNAIAAGIEALLNRDEEAVPR